MEGRGGGEREEEKGWVGREREREKDLGMRVVPRMAVIMMMTGGGGNKCVDDDDDDE